LLGARQAQRSNDSVDQGIPACQFPELACTPSGRCLVVYSDPWNAGADFDTDIWCRFVDVPFFADGFEDGDTIAWNSTVP
jgi:hypothetical protein